MKLKELNQKIEDANKEYEKVMMEVLKKRKEMERELEAVKEKYNPILESLEEDLSNKWKKFRELAGIYHDYGCFKYDKEGDISDILCSLLTYVEGEKFIPYTGIFDIRDGSIIIKEKTMQECDKTDWNFLDKLYNSGDLIIVDKGLSDNIELYNFAGEPNYKFGEFDYLSSFVEELIQYRLDNNEKEDSNITMDELYSCMCKFISTHPELIEKNKDKREKMLTEQDEEVLKQVDYKIKKLR